MVCDISAIQNELVQKKRDLERVNKYRDFLLTSILHLENICDPSKKLIGGRILVKHLIDVFVRSMNRPMTTFMLINFLERLPHPVKTTPAKITAVIHQNKSQFTAIGRGTYKLCNSFYKQFSDASTNRE